MNWKEFPKFAQFLLLFMIILFIVPFPNFYETGACPEFVGATEADCDYWMTYHWVNLTMILINGMNFYHINFSYFIFSLPLSLLITFLIIKKIKLKK